MSKRAFNKIKSGLEDARAILETKINTLSPTRNRRPRSLKNQSQRIENSGVPNVYLTDEFNDGTVE